MNPDIKRLTQVQENMNDFKFNAVYTHDDKCVEVYLNPAYAARGIESVALSLNITWSLDFELRKWGVKDIHVYVEKLIFDYTFIGEMGDPVGEDHRFVYPDDKIKYSSLKADEIDADTLYKIYNHFTVDYYLESKGERTIITPSFQIDFEKHLIQIIF